MYQQRLIDQHGCKSLDFHTKTVNFPDKSLGWLLLLSCSYHIVFWTFPHIILSHTSFFLSFFISFACCELFMNFWPILSLVADVTSFSQVLQKFCILFQVFHYPLYPELFFYYLLFLILFISYHIISYHIISYHIISYHIISYRIISYHIIYHIISYQIISYRIRSYHIIYPISYHLFSFCKFIQDYIIHMDMEIVIFVGIKVWHHHKCVQQSHGYLVW